MAARGSKLLHVGGHLIGSPLTLGTPGADGSYGGTILGTFQAFRLRMIPRSNQLTAEEYGDETVDDMHLGFDVEATAILRNYDSDALAAWVQNSAAAGGSSVNRQLFETGSTLVPGQWMSDFSSVLLWAPLDSAHPGLLVYNAVPAYRDTIELRLSAYEDLAVEDVRWLCLRDASDRVYRLADMPDLVTAGP